LPSGIIFFFPYNYISIKESAMSHHDLSILTVSANNPLGSLTLQALLRINEADLIIHDDLIAEELRDFWSHGSRSLEIPSSPAGSAEILERTIAAIVSSFRSGQRVLRIVADQASLVNRLHEEVKELQRRRLKYRFIPNREAFEKEAWQLKLPWLTDHLSSRFAIIESLSLKADAAFWRELARGSHTLAVDAAQGSLKHFVEQLLEAGADPGRPVALVSHSPVQDPLCWLTTLDEVDELLPQWNSKASTLFYVGAWPQASSRGPQQDFWGPLAPEALQWLRTGRLTAIG
jgi:siroheme synthase